MRASQRAEEDIHCRSVNLPKLGQPGKFVALHPNTTGRESKDAPDVCLRQHFREVRRECYLAKLPGV